MRRADFYKVLIIFVLLFFSKSLNNYCLAADPVYPETAVRISSDRRCLACGYTVINKDNALADNGTYSRMYANPGLAFGLVGYKAELELRFGELVPANTTTYIRIEGEESLLQSLLGGSLGDLISKVVGSLLYGNQEIIIDARTSSGSVLSRSSIAGFDTDRVRLVTDESGNYFIAIKPGSSYDRIRITNKSSAVAGLGAEYILDVYHAFYYEPDICDTQPTFTSFDGSGISLDVLDLNEAVKDLGDAIDGDLDGTFSQITLGVVGVAGTVEQMIYFNSPVQPGNEILISMATGESLLDLGLLNNVDLVAYSNGMEVSSTSASSLLELDVLGLLASDEFFKFPISDAVYSIDQIGIRVSSLVGLGLLEGSLKVSGVTVAPIRPAIPDIPEEGFFEICYGQTVTVTPINEAGGELHWYRIESSSEVSMGTTDSYSSPVDLSPGEYEFLVKSNNPNCSGQSEPSRFKIKVNPIPTPANYTIQPSGELGIDEEGKYTYVEGIHPVTLNPILTGWSGDGEFEWYLDETMIIKLQDGDFIGDVLYEIDEGSLTMTGLEFRDETDPYKFYLSWVPVTGCGPTEVKELDLSSIARILNVSLQSFDAYLTLEEEVALNWKFTFEKLNQRIIVQRAGSDLVFQDIWQGELSKNKNFTYLDSNPLPGDSYYRLEVRNQLGQSEFTSSLKRIYIAELSEKSFTVFPNEFEDFFTIGSPFDEDKKITFELYSGEGSLLKKGATHIANQAPIQIVGLGSHAPGEYFLVIKENERIQTHHLIKK